MTGFPPPAVPGIPVLGNALRMMGDVQQFFVDAYRKHGPVFRVRALNQAFVIMAGAAANRFLLERGEEVFTSEESFGGLNREFGMRVHVLRGRAHRHLRKLLATGLSRDLLAARWDAVAAETERLLDGWADTRDLPVVDACQRLAAAQLSIAYTGATSAARFETLRSAFELVLDVTIAGKWPAATLRWPAYRRSKAEIHRFARAALAERAPHPVVRSVTCSTWPSTRSTRTACRTRSTCGREWRCRATSRASTRSPTCTRSWCTC